MENATSYLFGSTLGLMLLLFGRYVLIPKQKRGLSVLIICGFYIFIIFLGLVGYVFNTNEYSFYNTHVSNGQILETAAAILYLCSMIIIGSMISAVSVKSFARIQSVPDYTFKRGEFSYQLWLSTVGISIGAIVFLIIGIGYSNLILRYEYLVDVNHVARIVGDTLTLISIFMLGYVFGVRFNTSVRKVIIAVLTLLLWLILFARATREFALVPVIFMTGLALSWQFNKQAKFGLICCSIFTVLIMPIPLTLRGLGEYGLIPFTDPQILAHARWVSLWQVCENIAFGLPLAAYVQGQEFLGYGTLLISINPLPGFLAGWYGIYEQLRFSRYQPYSALGELLNYGYLVAGLYYFIVGFILNYLECSAFSVNRSKSAIRPIIIIFALLYAVISTQYNLRNSTRLIYYLIAMCALLWAYNKFNIAKQRGLSRISSRGEQ